MNILINLNSTPMDSSEKAAASNDEEEILFVEDRRRGRVSPVQLKQNQDCTKPEPIEKCEDYIQFNSPDNKQLEAAKAPDEADGGNKELDKDEQTTPSKENAKDFLFVVEDRNPHLTGQDTQSPRYNISENFLKVQDKSQSKRNKLSNACWNCGETTHALRDCPEPRNHAQISRSRKEFQDSKGSMPVYKRYHVDEGQKFSSFVPGDLSENLRHALGLEPRQLPSHIYMMRRLGYPPGWLLEATVSHSGIAMFDGQGKEVVTPSVEQGEVLEPGSLDKFDINKIMRYPGFNIPPLPDTYDDSKYWGCPPLSKRQSVEVMIERLSGRIVGGYKRKKLSFNATSSELDESSQSVDSHEMEYEETPEGAELPEDNCKFVPPLPEEELPPPPPLDLPDEPVETDTDSQSLLSTTIEDTSLTDLEEQKKQLLAQLNDVSPLCSTPQSRIGKVKSVDLGTPILKSVSPYERLPSADKFSINICDVINFENLPDSTGKYEKMSGIIRKVRVKLSKINNEL